MRKKIKRPTKRSNKDPHVKHNRALHERLFVLTVNVQSIPWIKDSERLTIEQIAPNFWRASARYGFMEHPNIPILLQAASSRGCAIDLSDVTYYVGHEIVVHGEDGKRQPNSSSMPYDDKTIENPECDRWKDKKVDRRDAVGMVAQKRAPALRWWARVAAHIPSDCRLSDLEAELEQFTMNAWGRPRAGSPGSSRQ